MPRKTIDYTKTIIYKITCKTPAISFVYIDYTSNFRNKKNFHKCAVNGNRTDIELYNMIRNNGGWENWEMTEIEKVECKNKEEAIVKKNEYEKIYTAFHISENEKNRSNSVGSVGIVTDSGTDSGNINNEVIMNTDNLTKLFIDNVKENREFQKQMFEMIKDNIGGNNTINSHNKTMNNFNLQFFLNETCKDAMNINDFIEYVKVKLEDFEHFGEVGYPRALGDIIIRNLNELEVHQRPIHCSDIKREVLYIKHDGVWHNDLARDFMKRSIMYIAHKNIKQIPIWLEANPESKNHHSKTFERYNKMFRASLGASNDEEQHDFLKKITSIVAKEVVIDKKNCSV